MICEERTTIFISEQCRSEYKLTNYSTGYLLLVQIIERLFVVYPAKLILLGSWLVNDRQKVSVAFAATREKMKIILDFVGYL